jgi:hypothetical protein
MISFMFLFGAAVFYGSSLIARNHGKMERSELALYIVLIAWGSLLAGMTLLSHRAS